MINPTYRSLDAPVKVLGFNWRQWLALIVGGGGVIALAHFSGMPTRPAVTVCALVIGVPTAFAYLSEETGFSFGRLFADMLRWRFGAQRYVAGAGERVSRVVVLREQDPDDAVARNPVAGAGLPERLDERWEGAGTR